MISFEESGFIILKNFFAAPALHRFERRIVELYEEAADKVDIRVIALSNHEKLSKLLEAMEENHKAEAYAVQKLIETDSELHELFDENFYVMMDVLMGGGRRSFTGGYYERLKMRGLCLFINRPRTQRLLAKWHSERHYYPDLGQFVNCHFPVFTDKTKDNGAMSILPGSHLMKWTFEGYSPGKDAIYQKEIGEEQVKGYQSVFVEEKRGDACFFHANLVHKSNENTSDKYSFAMVCRVYVP